ncbi:MAG: hypothetical protein GXY32_05640 [Ruminococcaceae bacterium]|nr:hypothetical protein [Oscillospiraceae bacterium]
MKKQLACLALACLLLVAMAACGTPTGQTASHDHPVYTNYRDIPGVTSDEISQIEALR